MNVKKPKQTESTFYFDFLSKELLEFEAFLKAYCEYRFNLITTSSNKKKLDACSNLIRENKKQSEDLLCENVFFDHASDRVENHLSSTNLDVDQRQEKNRYPLSSINCTSHLFKKGISTLRKSIEYTLFASCKRFRPALSIAACKDLSINYKKCFPLAMAVEFIHTASLIHDDLPCMDNDQIRRNQASNHIVFKEDMALLAGDSLFVEAFYILSYFQQSHPVINQVSEASSVSGMMGGQSIDILGEKSTSFSDIQQTYQMKTGALLMASVNGATCLGKTPLSLKKKLKLFSYYLGLSFQLADDILDQHSKDKVSIFSVMDKKEAKNQFDKWIQKSLSYLDGIKAPSLTQIVQLLKESVK